MADEHAHGSWFIESHTGSAGELHQTEMTLPSRWAMVCHVQRPALVLGSTQRDEVVDQAAATAAGVEVVRRRTGGGAVLVAPGTQLWIDLWLPAADPLVVRDVGRSFDWVSDVWRRALADLGVDASPHRGKLDPCRWGRLVCFGGMGPGELAIDGKKAVGFAQRRGRSATRFQCAALLAWDPAALVSLLRLGDGDRATAIADLGESVTTVGLDGGDLARAVLAHLP